MLGALLGAGASLAGIGMQMGAQQDANNINWRNLFLQERTARENSKLAKATRMDAYGNKIRYRDGEGFITELTPLQKAILDTQQNEQYRQFSEDAPRNREAALRMDARSKQADEVWNEKFNKYRYATPQTEQGYEGEAIRDAIAIRDSDNEGAGNAAFMAMRTGSSSEIPEILAASRSAKPSLAEVLAGAKKQGKQQYFAEQQARNATAFDELNQLRSVADTTSQGQQNWSNENAALSGRSDNALSGLIATNQQGASAQGNAMAQLAASLGKSPDVGGLAGVLAGIKMPEKKSWLEQAAYDQGLFKQLTGDMIGTGKNNALLDAMYRGNTGAWG